LNESEKQPAIPEEHIENETQENKTMKTFLERKQEDMFQSELFKENRKKALERLRQYKMVCVDFFLLK
jgi:hypothetical protein